MTNKLEGFTDTELIYNSNITKYDLVMYIKELKVRLSDLKEREDVIRKKYQKGLEYQAKYLTFINEYEGRIKQLEHQIWLDNQLFV